ncbi:carbohydrate ABC transporter substrate-binding protein, CUT1 family [Amycolatopsis tolypomycina]|uniref:Carbohydrate ABC transporter substrate-binding protein, CUT1 family n=1 Tax=Amycolatopsis tolypomycina TaxID=208445 RepID=A0A1H4Y9S3_9PSEU|nr:extracellular solute-binding protein [Amycolatopsis tolypomycina]SED14736.1 carbohydrate ABC transporter substrate-binding protein, CUT1 family [Amycolatopsis tolypomycina]
MNRCAGLVLVVVLLLSGCAAGSGTEVVTVLGPWTGDEQKAFRQVLDGFTRETGIPVDYQGTRAQNQVLRGDLQQGTPPHVAVLSNPAELAGYVGSGDVKPLDAVLDAEVRAAYSPQWRRLQQLGGNAVYAVVVKADLKSIVWYTPKSFPGPVPSTWDELVAVSRRLAAAGQRPWCLGMGAPPNSGFPGTDWLEDILLHRAGPGVYSSWAAGRLAWTDPAVADAWQSWGALVPAPGGGSTAALLTSFADAGRAMFADPPGCALEHLGSFAIGGYAAVPRPAGPPVPDRDFRFFPFPGAGGTGPSEVSADLAGMFRDTPAARRLMAYLAGAAGQRIWPSGGTTFSVHQRLVDEDVYRSDVTRRIATTLAKGGNLCFDASDLMPAAMTSAFYQAVLEYLADPARLPTLLDQLDRVRRDIGRDQWLDLPC